MLESILLQYVERVSIKEMLNEILKVVPGVLYNFKIPVKKIKHPFIYTHTHVYIYYTYIYIYSNLTITPISILQHLLSHSSFKGKVKPEIQKSTVKNVRIRV